MIVCKLYVLTNTYKIGGSNWPIISSLHCYIGGCMHPQHTHAHVYTHTHIHAHVQRHRHALQYMDIIGVNFKVDGFCLYIFTGHLLYMCVNI